MQYQSHPSREPGIGKHRIRAQRSLTNHWRSFQSWVAGKKRSFYFSPKESNLREPQRGLTYKPETQNNIRWLITFSVLFFVMCKLHFMPNHFWCYSWSQSSSILQILGQDSGWDWTIPSTQWTQYFPQLEDTWHLILFCSHLCSLLEEASQGWCTKSSFKNSLRGDYSLTGMFMIFLYIHTISSSQL